MKLSFLWSWNSFTARQISVLFSSTDAQKMHWTLVISLMGKKINTTGKLPNQGRWQDCWLFTTTTIPFSLYPCCKGDKENQCFGAVKGEEATDTKGNKAEVFTVWVLSNNIQELGQVNLQPSPMGHDSDVCPRIPNSWTLFCNPFVWHSDCKAEWS